MSDKLRIAMFGQKRLSREGGIEIVVKELATRMVKKGHEVTCYNRSGHHVSGDEFDDTQEKVYLGIKQKFVPTIEKKGLAAVSASFFAALSKIVKMLANTITGIGAVMLPRLSLHFAERKFDDVRVIVKNFFNATLTLSIPAAVGVGLLAKEIVILLFGMEFMPAVPTIIILSPLIVLMPLSGGVFGQLLLTSGNEKKYKKLQQNMLSYSCTPLHAMKGGTHNVEVQR